MEGCLHPLLTARSPGFCSQELLVLDIQFHSAEDMEYRAAVGKRPAASEAAVATVLQDGGFSVGQQQTQPRAGSATGPPQGPQQRVC